MLLGSALPREPADDTLSQSQLRALFERYAATYLFEVSHQPLLVAALRQPGFTAQTVDRN